MYPKGRIEQDSEPTYYGTAHFKEHKFELWRLVYKTKGRTHWAWFAKHDGQPESEFWGSRSPNPAQAIGHAVLALNPELSDRIYS